MSWSTHLTNTYGFFRKFTDSNEEEDLAQNVFIKM